jgi:hypothetical protein
MLEYLIRPFLIFFALKLSKNQESLGAPLQVLLVSSGATACLIGAGK